MPFNPSNISLRRQRSLPKYPYGRYTGHRYEAMELESYSETLGKQSHIDKL